MSFSRSLVTLAALASALVPGAVAGQVRASPAPPAASELLPRPGASSHLPAGAAVPFSEIADALDRVRQPSQVALAPDGRRFAYVETVAGHSGVRLAEVAKPSSPYAITACAGRHCDEGDVAWSPDGRRLAFVTTGPNGQGQIAVEDFTASRPARILTSAKGPLSTPRWSPDGTRIAFLYSPGAPKAPSPLNPLAPDAGVVGATAYEQRLALIPAAGGAPRLLGPADLNVYEFDWSPDGTRFAATAAHGNGDANWWTAQLYTIDAARGTATAIHRPELQIASPRWSGDGKRIAYIGGIMSDEAITGGDVYVVDAPSATSVPGTNNDKTRDASGSTGSRGTLAMPAGAPRPAAASTSSQAAPAGPPSATGVPAVDFTPNLRASVTTIAWNGSARTILATELAGDRMVIASIDPAARTQRQLWSGQQTIYASGFAGLAPGDTGVSLSRDGRIAATIRQSITEPPEIALGPLGAMHAVTSLNAHARRLTGAARSVTWTSEGQRVQGWLIFPPDRVPGVRYPVITYVHGGPAFAHYPIYPSGPNAFEATLAARGYIVFEPNPRGSYGAGEAFARANVKDFGYGDLRDILVGLDEVNRTIPVDPRRVGLFGWSYGGYMTMWSLTQTNRFKAAVAGAGVSDWLSYYGTNAIDTWMLPYFGASVYDDPAVYAKSSPINFIKAVKAPTLLVAGDRDAEVPVTQSYEYWHALRELGVPTQLVIYPGEGHEFAKPADQQDVARRMVGWFDHWLK